MHLLFRVIFVLLQIKFGLSALCSHPVEFPTDPNDLQYYLYLQPGTTTYTQLFYDQLSGVTFNKDCPVIIITHGFTHNAFMEWILDAKEKVFQAYACANIVLLDWSNVTSSYNYTNVITDINLVYPLTAYKTCKCGEYLAKILLEMNTVWNVPFSNMLLMGHSLGAHLVGCAGQAVKTESGIMVDYIIGMDPAGPMFNDIDPNCRLSEDDGTFVQAVRTDCGVLGYVGPIAQVDYYPNGGQNQPGCPNRDYPVPDICSHCYAYYVTPASFATSGSGFDARYCSDYVTYEADLCKNNALSQMGFYSDRNARGSFYLDTTDTYPYTKSGALTSQSILSGK